MECSRRRDFEHLPVEGRASFGRAAEAVEVAGASQGEAKAGIRSIGAVHILAEGMQHGESACGSYFVNGAVPGFRVEALFGYAVEIAVDAERDGTYRISTIRTAVVGVEIWTEAIETREDSGRRDLDKAAKSIRAIHSGSVQISVEALDQRA